MEMTGSLQCKTRSPCPTVHYEQTSQTMHSGYMGTIRGANVIKSLLFRRVDVHQPWVGFYMCVLSS